MEERIHRLANIRATAWTCIILFSLTGYYIFSNYLIPSMMIREVTPLTGDESYVREFSLDLNRTIVYSASVLISLIFAIYGSIGLLRMTENGLIIFHVSTILLTIALVVLAIYFANEFRMPTLDESPFGEEVSMFAKLSRVMSFTSTETILLVVAWLMSRANLMLFRKGYRKEFT